MPTVPRLDGPQVAATGFPGERFGAPQARNFAPQQLQQTGDAMVSAGDVATRIATEKAALANQLRVTDALNRVKEEQLRLTHDKDVGFSNLKGLNAIERPDGKPLAQEYGDLFSKTINEVRAGLGTDAQRMAFDQHASSL